MQSKVKLVRVEDNDANRISFIWEVRTNIEVDKFLNGEPPKSFTEHVNYLNSKRNEKAFFVIECDGEFCGYCQIDTVGEPECGWAILPQFWGKGIGGQSVEELASWCRGWNNAFERNGYETRWDNLILYVKEDNHRAIRVYEKNGFIPVGITDGQLKMEKKL